MYSLDFTLPGLPKTANGSHGKWQAAHAERKKWRTAACLAAKSRRPDAPLTKAALILTRHSSGKSDFDNRVRSMKSIIDGLVDAGILINDTDDVITVRQYPQGHAPQKKGFVRVQVIQLPDEAKP